MKPGVCILTIFFPGNFTRKVSLVILFQCNTNTEKNSQNPYGVWYIEDFFPVTLVRKV